MDSKNYPQNSLRGLLEASKVEHLNKPKKKAQIPWPDPSQPIHVNQVDFPLRLTSLHILQLFHGPVRRKKTHHDPYPPPFFTSFPSLFNAPTFLPQSCSWNRSFQSPAVLHGDFHLGCQLRCLDFWPSRQTARPFNP